MRNQLPLNALRAFEAAARHMSFSRAAEELCVTPTAISHQVRTLEDFLETSLFERKGGRLALTIAASAALEELSEGFDKLESAMLPLSRRAGAQRLVVAASPSVASLWLMPRLHRFVAAAPDVSVSLSSVIDPAGFGEGGFDIAICHAPDLPNRKAEFLMSERIVPVCAAALLAGCGGRRRHALATLPLIHDDKPQERFPTWRGYFDRLGIGRDAQTGLRFNQSSLAIEAALNGHGLLLGRSRLIAPLLARGQLRELADDTPPFEYNYFLMRGAGSGARSVRAFADWLLEEVRADDSAAAQGERQRPGKRSTAFGDLLTV